MKCKNIFLVLSIIFLVIITFSFSTYATEATSDTDDTQVNSEESSETWTDFSKAKVNLEKTSDVRTFKFSVSGVNPIDNHVYYYMIGDGTSTPDFSVNNAHQLSYDSSKKVFYSGNEISEYLELEQDCYVYVSEHFLNSNSEFKDKLVLEKIKLDKPEQKKYTDAFFATFISSDSDNQRVQILFDTPWGNKTVRKIHLRIGKISDDNILKNIYDKKNNAFENLLSYSKNSSAFYDKVVNSNADSSAAGGIIYNEQGTLFDTNNITKDDYYFLYAELDDENGKYVKTEGVTLARAYKSSIDNNNYALFFYGSDNFSWKTFEGNNVTTPTQNQTPAPTPTKPADPTIATQKLPNTGVSFLVIVAILIMSIIGIYSYKQYKKNNY